MGIETVEVSRGLGQQTITVDKADIPPGYHTPQEWSDIDDGKKGTVISGPSIPSSSSAEDRAYATLYTVNPNTYKGRGRVNNLRDAWVEAAVTGQEPKLTERQQKIATAVSEAISSLPQGSLPESSITGAIAGLRNQASRAFNHFLGKSDEEIRAEREQARHNASLEFSEKVLNELNPEQLAKIGSARLYE